MPPRYAFWTILIDRRPTAFRAREQAELLPTLHQLRRTNADVVMKWFAQGRLWDSPEQQRDARRRTPDRPEKRGPDWRPGGQHQDPRDRFKKKPRASGSKPWRSKSGDSPREGQPSRRPFAGPGRRPHKPRPPKRG